MGWWEAASALGPLPTDIQGPRPLLSCGSAFLGLPPGLLGTLIQQGDGEREMRVAHGRVFASGLGAMTSLPPTFHWLELGHVVIPNSKGGWEMESHCVPRDPCGSLH